METYAKAYPQKLRLQRGNIKTTLPNKYAVSRKNPEYTPTVKNIVAKAHAKAESAICDAEILFINRQTFLYRPSRVNASGNNS